MQQPENLHLDVRMVPPLESAIDQWLAARDQFKIEPSDENLFDYDATLHDLGAVWNERYPDDADTPEAFQWYRRCLIATEEEWSSLQQKLFNDHVPFQAASSEVFGLPT